MKKENCSVNWRVRVGQLLVVAQEHLDLKEYDAAEKVLLKSLREKETAAGWRGMASVHCLREDVEKTIEALEKAVELDENDHLSLGMLAHALHSQGDFINAFGFYALAVRAGRDIFAYKQSFSDITEHVSLSDFNPQIRLTMLDCLETPGVNCNRMSRMWHNLLRLDPDFSQIYRTVEESDEKKFDKKFFDNARKFRALTDPFFLLGLQRMVVYETVFEEFLTYLRAFLLDQREAAEPKLSRLDLIEIASSLAQYCFFTEYIFDCTEDEQQKIDALRLKLDADGGEIDDTAALAIYACYAPLCGLKRSREIVEKYKVHADMGSVVKSQILEQDELRVARTSIPAMTAIDDGISLKVQQQYEEFPFPRWKDFGKEMLDPSGLGNHFAGKPIDILVAGCGTGQEAMQFAASFPAAKILAVDLSRTSLSYAAMRAKENNCSNITFAQADILRLGELDRKFDYISSCGVLHHMEDPIRGWKVLCGLLADGGMMRIALYSKTARRSYIEMMRLIREKNIAPTADGMRFFRRNLRALMGKKDTDKISSRLDYYIMSGLRDFLFHTQERQFTLPEIGDILGEMNFEFIELNQFDSELKRYREKFPDDPSATSLTNWHKYEEEYPDTFGRMYSFWCRRKK